MNSRQKGKRGELELAKVLRSYGYDSHRGQQYKGSADSPDVTGIDGYHIECKRVEALNVYNAYEQSVRDCGGDIPIVVWRKNNKQWLVVISLDDFIKEIKRNDND